VRLRAVLPQRELAQAAARARTLGVADRVELLHDVDDEQLAALYRGAAATAMPSTIEGFGLPALESIACGVPVVLWSGCEAVAEIVGDRGRSMETWQDASEWAAALSEAVNAHRRVDPPLAAHDWDRTAGIVSDVLERAAT
jgi:glycosyltransferase involved in cell wall biosynthesis